MQSELERSILDTDRLLTIASALECYDSVEFARQQAIWGWTDSEVTEAEDYNQEYIESMRDHPAFLPD